MSSLKVRSLFIATLLFGSSAAFALPVTAFYFTSSPESYIGAGETVYASAATGFSIVAAKNHDNGLLFYIDNSPTTPDFADQRYWSLDLAAPFGSLLQVGAYEDATRWPFQDADKPGLTFSGNYKGNNTLFGRFDVLEATYDVDENVLSFAANFVQYDEYQLAWKNEGSIRFNSSVPIAALTPVPEPSQAALLGLGLLALGARSWRSTRR